MRSCWFEGHELDSGSAPVSLRLRGAKEFLIPIVLLPQRAEMQIPTRSEVLFLLVTSCCFVGSQSVKSLFAVAKRDALVTFESYFFKGLFKVF